MIKRLGVPALLPALAVLFASCGDEVTNVTSTGLSVIQKGEKMVECTEDNVGDVVLVEDSATVFYCADGEWRTMNGRDGTPGADGINGKNGKDGQSAKDTVVINNRDTVIVEKRDTVVVRDSVTVFDSTVVFDTTVVHDTTVVYDTTVVLDTAVVLYTPEYDTVPTDFLNQEMLADGKYGILVDKRDGKVYRTVKIGTQTWMAQNLDYTDGTIMSYCYDNDAANCKKYGRLYYWAQANALQHSYNTQRAAKATAPADSIIRYPNRGLCPEGWHVPDSTEWNKLNDWIAASNKINYDDEGVGMSVKSASEQAAFSAAETRGTDRYGFSAAPTGRLADGVFTDIAYWGLWWSSSESSDKYVHGRNICYNHDELGKINARKLDTRAVRCVMD